uniref:Uncharacterized protein n=1 Tax=Rhizophagus irregularis (strain DAOM 181602 / DAOM 197198 / MUCL 43194) TaxID=747089 RepID=U9UAX4_RHIID
MFKMGWFRRFSWCNHVMITQNSLVTSRNSGNDMLISIEITVFYLLFSQQSLKKVYFLKKKYSRENEKKLSRNIKKFLRIFL